MRALHLLCLLLTSTLLVSCGDGDEPPVRIGELLAYEPVPGSETGVVYFVVDNQSGKATTLQRVDSPDYARVEMHESIVNDGIMTMLPMNSVTVAADSSVRFEAGGKHVMLMQPRGAYDAGYPIELRFHFADGQVVSVSTSLQSRFKE